MKSKAKNYISSILLLGVLAATITFAVIEYIGKGLFAGDTLIVLLLVFLGIVLNAIISITLHEIGHVLAGFCVGYSLDFVSIGFLQFSRRGIRFSLKKGYGRTSMTPRNARHFQGKMFFYLLGGSVFSLLFAVMSTLLLFMDFSLSQNWYIVFSSGFIIAPYLFFREILPYSSAINESDGDKMFGIISHSKQMQVNLKVFTLQALMMSGKSPKEIDKAIYFDIPIVPDNMTERILLENYRYLYYIDTDDTENIAKSAAFLAETLEDLPDIYYDGMKADLFFYAAFFERDFEKAEKLYVDLYDFISSENNIVNLTYKMAFALYIEKDSKKAVKLGSDALALKDDYIVAGISKVEEKLVLAMLGEAKLIREEESKVAKKIEIGFTEYKG